MNGYNRGFGDGYVFGAANGGGGSVEPLTVTENGTYTADEGGYSPVTVNVKGENQQKISFVEMTVIPPFVVVTPEISNKAAQTIETVNNT